MTAFIMWRGHWLAQALYARRTGDRGALIFAKLMLRNLRRGQLSRMTVTRRL